MKENVPQESKDVQGWDWKILKDLSEAYSGSDWFVSPLAWSEPYAETKTSENVSDEAQLSTEVQKLWFPGMEVPDLLTCRI